jgi:hypothetical protein
MSVTESVMDLVREQFAACQEEKGLQAYKGRQLAFFDVVDSVDAGRQYVAAFPGQYNALCRRFRGCDAFLPDPLPAFATFAFPEHDLTPRQQRGFVSVLLDRHPECQQVVIVTTSDAILIDAVPGTIRTVRSVKPDWEGVWNAD